VAGAAFLTSTAAGLRLLGVPVVAAALAFVLLAPEGPASPAPGPRRSLRSLLAFPRGAPQFVRALAGRLLLMLGYFSVAGYQLYLLTDYVRLEAAGAASTIVAIGLTAAVARCSGRVWRARSRTGSAVARPRSSCPPSSSAPR
jgi:hypothetical protein